MNDPQSKSFSSLLNDSLSKCKGLDICMYFQHAAFSDIGCAVLQEQGILAEGMTPQPRSLTLSYTFHDHIQSSFACMLNPGQETLLLRRI
jgi:hypothetical protein